MKGIWYNLFGIIVVIELNQLFYCLVVLTDLINYEPLNYRMKRSRAARDVTMVTCGCNVEADN